MDTLKQLALIETTIARRGSGVKDSPIRVITQYWTPAGELVFERDPTALTVTIEQRAKITEAVFKTYGETDKARDLLFNIGALMAQSD